MLINNIKLENIGPYKGTNLFDFTVTKDKNIILIGGKNGAGKTTLFNAIRLCLYGYKSLGYKNSGTGYIKAVKNIINNETKFNESAKASISMIITINSGQQLDRYEMNRFWILNSSNIKEEFKVKRNDILLSDEELNDFEKFIMYLIPPELFNLYFFDGEKISDFFVNKGSNLRLKNAFLKLCGYDTFEIMKSNFLRLVKNNPETPKNTQDYINKKDEFNNVCKELKSKREELESNNNLIDQSKDELKSYENEYLKKGGTTNEEWNLLLMKLREEDKKREQWNLQIKNWANSIIPFLISYESIKKLKKKLVKDSENIKFKNFLEVLDQPDIKKYIKNKNKITKTINQKINKSQKYYYDLSNQQLAQLLSQIETIENFEINDIFMVKDRIQQSINKSKKYREKLEKCNVSSVESYMKQKSIIEKRIEELYISNNILYVELNKLETDKVQKQKELDELEKQMAISIKNNNIKNISTRSLVMIQELIDILYKNQIQKISSNFNTEINKLIRKKNVIDDIEIDNEFNITLYRNESVPIDEISRILKNNDQDAIIRIYGNKFLDSLLLELNCDSEKILENLKKAKATNILIPLKVEEETLSNGEKQVFIMALYHSLVKLGRVNIPFVIDTPFARIDTQHRLNISKNFFTKLEGQIFILSTNEEIESEQFNILQDKISHTYLLENEKGTKTTISADKYFRN